MKIDEPKTPWAPSYDPARDEREDLGEAEDLTLDAHDLVVDELDLVNSARQKKASGPVRDNEIPDFELGEPEEDIRAQQNLAAAGGSRITRERSLSQNSNRSDKHVDVVVDEEGSGHGEGLITTEEAREKHRQFEELRKKHYEMKNIKDLLAYASFLTPDLDSKTNESVVILKNSTKWTTTMTPSSHRQCPRYPRICLK